MTATLEDLDYNTVVVPLEDGETITLAQLKTIEDLQERGAKAAALTRAAEERSDYARSIRDMYGLVLIQPYQAVQRPYDDTMEAIDKALEDGTLDPKTAHRDREAAKAKRREGMENVTYKPVHVYRDTIGVSRGLFVRMQHRAAQQLPEFVGEDHTPLTPEEIQQKAIEAREQCKLYGSIADDAREIRDEVATMLLNGNPKIGRPAMSNADVSRLMKLTTARVAQMRYGTR